MANFLRTFSKSNIQREQFVDGFVDDEIVQSSNTIGGIHNGSQHNLIKAAAQIRALLQELEQAYPTKTRIEKQKVVTEAIKRIESNQLLKAAMAEALREPNIEHFKQAANHPLVTILMAALEGWQLD